MGEGKSTLIVGIMGWVVAALSLALNFATYRQVQYDREMRLVAEPAFQYSIKSYNPEMFPANFRALNEETPHPFEVRHISGKQVRDLTLQFASPEREITRIEINNGKPDTAVAISTGGREAVVKRPQLLENTTIEGVVYTKGLATVSLAGSAGTGKPLSAIPGSGASGGWGIDREDVFIISFLMLLVIAGIVLFMRAYPKIESSGILAILRDTDDNIPLLILILALSLVRGVGDILQGFVLYFVVTRYRVIINLLNKFRTVYSPQRGNVKSTEQSTSATPKDRKGVSPVI